jgi:glycosyltransferase involved in cell wall biosynthesis
MTSASGQRKLLFLIPEDWYVCSHRLPLIRGARAEGMTVTVVTRVGKLEGPIVEAGAKVISGRLRRGFSKPLQDLAGLIDLIRIYRSERPDIVHHVTPKSCLYGSLVARLTGVTPVVNAMAGLGFLYTATGLKARLLRLGVSRAFKFLLAAPASRLIVQNNDDGAFFIREIGLDPDKVILIRGAGVDTEQFQPVAPPTGKIRICLAARLIKEKGLFETAAAARILLAERQDLEFVIAGESDGENPSAVSTAQLQAWHDEGIFSWLGRVEDMAGLLKSCHIGLLPSYYSEGFPKSLLEAAACGLPLISTDMTGCREICQAGVNGVHVAVKDVESIVAAVRELATDADLRTRYGQESRRLVVENFSEEIVVGQTMALYREMLGREQGRE